jgi:hypothetical protein
MIPQDPLPYYTALTVLGIGKSLKIIESLRFILADPRQKTTKKTLSQAFTGGSEDNAAEIPPIS